MPLRLRIDFFMASVYNETRSISEKRGGITDEIFY